MRFIAPITIFSTIGPIVLILCLILNLAEAANLGVWEIDFDSDDNGGCASHKAELQGMYDDAAELASAAVKDLDAISRPRPQGSNEAGNFDRVAKHSLAFLGISIDQNTRSGRGDWLSYAKRIFNTMHATFEGAPPPRHGNQDVKPTIACGDKGWIHLKKDDPDPNVPGKKLSETWPDFVFGAFYWKGRYRISGPDSTVPKLCEKDTYGLSYDSLNLIVLCDLIWGRKRLADLKSSAKLDSTFIEKVSESSGGSSLIHEFSHYFGGAEVIDYQARSGSMTNAKLWYNPQGRPTPVEPKDEKAKKDFPLTYGHERVVNLAKYSNQNNKDESIKSAECYTFFALSAYLSDFDWTLNRARKTPINAKRKAGDPGRKRSPVSFLA